MALLLAVGARVEASRLEVTIDPVFNGEPLRLDSLRYQTAADEMISVTRLSYLLTGVALQRQDGQWVEFPKSTAWMDLAARRRVFQVEDVAEGSYQALRFYIGPDAIANAADVSKIPADDPLNPNLNGLHWSWQGGYIFMAFEGHYRTGSEEPKGYAHHLARDPNRTSIRLSAALDLRKDAGVQIHFDVANLLNAPRPLSFERDGTATHSREGDPIAAALVSNLRGAFRVNRIVSEVAATAALPKVAPIDLPAKFTPYRFTLSRTFPVPDLPRDNPLIVERVSLGEKLFNDKRLSRDGSISCATCHQPDAGFTDRLAVSRGIEGRSGDRNSMPLFNLAWKREFFWDGRAKSLREQVLMPIQDHREMDQSLEKACEDLAASAEDVLSFKDAFATPGITAQKVSLALEQYLLTLSARNSRFDRAFAGKASLSDEEKRGFELFMTEYEPRTGQNGADCFHCHGGALFSDHQFHDNGLEGEAPGRAKVTGSPGDQGKFSTPSLRNVALTAPYMHDGRFATLEEVVEHYSTGIHRRPMLDPNLAKHPETGLNLSAPDKAALVAFLKTLTEESLPPP
ncbi:MAG: cytochrome C peroxidase [Verrucomicrobiales bacterium VVV1]|nr:MAG: cytochrome C peroxidase [Verrucomicrobiales bacterium VVV1]